MDQQLREAKKHGTQDYPYSQYYLSGLPAGFRFPVHWHEEVELIYIRQGGLLVNAGGGDFLLSEGEVLFVNSRQLHRMESAEEDVAYYTLLFPLEFISFLSADLLDQQIFRPLRTGQRILPNLMPADVLTDKTRELLEKVIAINEQKPPLYQMETRLLLLEFLLAVLRSAELLPADQDAGDELQRQMLAYIRSHYRQQITLEELGKQFHLSPKYLSRYFKEKFSITISDYVSHLRMNYAKQLLENTRLSITEVAAQSGYSSVSFFIRSFTQANGCSPLKWRHRNTGQINE